jgi:hypothetical protein
MINLPLKHFRKSLLFLNLFILFCFFNVSLLYSAQTGYIENDYMIFKGVKHGNEYIRSGWYMIDKDWLRAYNGASIATRGRLYVKGDLIKGADSPKGLDIPFMDVMDTLTTTYNCYFNNASIGSVADIYEDGFASAADRLNHFAGFVHKNLAVWQFRDFVNTNNYTCVTPTTAFSQFIINDRTAAANGRQAMKTNENFAIATNKTGSCVFINLPRLNFGTLESVRGLLSCSIANMKVLTIEPVSGNISIKETATSRNFNKFTVVGDTALKQNNYLYLTNDSQGSIYDNCNITLSGGGTAANNGLLFFAENKIYLTDDSDIPVVKFDVGNNELLFKGRVQLGNESDAMQSYRYKQASMYILKDLYLGCYSTGGPEHGSARVFFNGMDVDASAPHIYLEKRKKTGTVDDTEIRICLSNTATAATNRNRVWQIGTQNDSVPADTMTGIFPFVDKPYWAVRANGYCYGIDYMDNTIDHFPHDEETHDSIRVQDYTPSGTTPPSAVIDKKQKVFLASRTFTAFGDAFKASDIRLKHYIEPITNSLDKILNIHGVTYYWKSPLEIKRDKVLPKKLNTLLNYFLDTKVAKFFSNEKSSKQKTGFIAQEVEIYFPGLVYTGSNDYKNVNTEGFIPLLVSGFKEQQIKLQGIDKDLNFIKNKLKSLKND